MTERTIGAVALQTTGNASGATHFLNLATGCRITRQHWTELPAPPAVIDRIHQLADEAGMPDGMEYRFNDGTIIPDTLEDLEYLDDDPLDSDFSDSDSSDDETLVADSDSSDDDFISDDDDDASYEENDEDDNAEINITDDTPAVEATGVDNNPDNPTDQSGETPGVGEIPGAGEIPGVGETEGESTGVGAPEADITVVNENSQQQQDQPTLTSQQIHELMEKRYGRRPEGRGLRPRKPRKYAFKEFTIGGATFFTMDNDLVKEAKDISEKARELSLATEQMFLEKGLKFFGEKGTEAVLKEVAQLHEREVGEAVHPSMMTREEKQNALRYLMYLKRKRCGRVKARGCADGRKQRKWKNKEDSSSPTPRLETIMLISLIAAKERRCVKCIDVPGAFMQADVDELIHVKMEGEMAKLYASLCPETYNKFVTYEHGKPMLYLKLNKALYGTLQAALLFYKDLSGFLVNELNFELNEYDECVANKIINGKQCTIVWHVDDLQISHVDEKVVDEIIGLINEKYGKREKVTVSEGKVHDYLGMTLDFSMEGKVSIKMLDYVKSIICNCPDDFAEGTAVTPALNNLFTNDDTAPKLSTEQAEEFHTNVAKLLFLCKRARPDIHTAVAFLTTRVKDPDVHDWKKLGRVIRYLRGTGGLYLTLEADSLDSMKWYVDASFAVHTDMRSHTGVSMSMEKGAVYSNSSRQKINTRSSTEAELVGVDDALSKLLWMRKFMAAQGYPITDNIVYQDSQSAILLERNGKRSSTKRTRHLDVRYYFVTDRINAGELRIQYCPTERMWGDMHTKPQQGSLFRMMRKWHLNCVIDDFELPSDVEQSQECVGTQSN